MDKQQFEFKNKFVTFMKSAIPELREVSGGSELMCRCRYCSDRENNNNGHMYIKVPQAINDPILFHCFKCQTSGVLDSKALMNWGIYDPIMGIELDKLNNESVNHYKRFEYSKQWFTFMNHIQNLALAQRKLDYINDRLGSSLNFSDCLANKIILNLKDAIDFNNITQYTRHPNIVEQLNYNFLGFLSLDNNFVNLRRICPEGYVYHTIDKRYINYNIFGKCDNTEKMYVLPGIIDLSRPEKINIHIAEGPFDILSIKYNLRKNENGIFTAITGSGYKGLILHLINLFKIYYFDIHLYPDNDDIGNSEMIEEIKYIIKPYGATLYEHRNIYPNEKDFGVPSSKINEKIYVH